MSIGNVENPKFDGFKNKWKIYVDSIWQYLIFWSFVYTSEERNIQN